MQAECLLSTVFSNWPKRLNLFEKARFLENLRKKLWNLDNTSRSNQVNSCSYYSFRVPRKFHRKTSDRVATQSLSSVVNRVLNDTQRSTGQFFSEQTVVHDKLPDQAYMYVLADLHATVVHYKFFGSLVYRVQYQVSCTCTVCDTVHVHEHNIVKSWYSTQTCTQCVFRNADSAPQVQCGDRYTYISLDVAVQTLGVRPNPPPPWLRACAGQ